MEQIQPTIKEIKIGSRFTTECLNLNHEGQGVCKITGSIKEEIYENFPLFVNEFIPKEKGIIEITKLSKTYGYGKVVTLFRETK